VSESESGKLAAFLDDVLGDHAPLAVEPMVGGGSCEIFGLRRGDHRWVLRRAPSHASSSTAHDVTREYRVLDAIKDSGVRIPRPIAVCADPAIFEAPFYVMERIDGEVVRAEIPAAWTARPDEQHRAFEELIDALAEIHLIDWQAVGLGELGHPDGFLERQVSRWMAQLASYGGRDLPLADDLAAWLDGSRPAAQAPALFHGDYKIDNVLFAPGSPPHLLAVVDWEMCSIGDPLVDLAWALIFHPRPGAAMALGTHGEHAFDPARVPPADSLVARYAERTGRDVTRLDWYEVFARWKLAIVLEGSYAKFVRGESTKPVHEYFGRQADALLSEARARTEVP
jgi:aminoglycoside phosphotransferase (APT) family kinase protein